MADGPLVTIRLPEAIHLTAANWTCSREMPHSISFSKQHMASSFGQLPASNFNSARFTTRLGLGGLDLAIAA